MEIHEIIEPTQCEILGVFGLIVQGALGVLSFTALLVKRYFENPKRTWLIWVLDTSKQIFSAALAHCINMMLAILLSSSHVSDNWDWYFINTASDVCIGIFICYLLLISVERVASRLEIHSLNTGVYIKDNSTEIDIENFDPEKQEIGHQIDYKIYFIQLIVWGLIVIISKVLLYVIQTLFAPILETVTTVMLGWMNIYPRIKLLLIMVVIPFIFNSIQFWIQDNILKANKQKNIEFVSNARVYRSMTFKPRRYPKLDGGQTKITKRSESLTSANGMGLKL